MRYLRRWLVGHQLHAALVVAAARWILRACHCLPDREGDAAAGLQTAAVFVRGVPAARAYALTLPPSYYQDVLRPPSRPDDAHRGAAGDAARPRRTSARPRARA
jgi:hypothetical protein